MLTQSGRVRLLWSVVERGAQEVGNVFSLTGPFLFRAAVVAAVVGPILLIVWLRRSTRRSWGRSLLQLIAVGSCQVVAVAGLFFYVNNAYGFYTSWSDLLGRSGQGAQIQTAGLVRHGQGRVQLMTVPGTAATGGSHQVLTWLPPQYDDAQRRNTRFPVLMVLTGQPSTPQAMFRHFAFGSVATKAIDSGRIKPFIAVFPPLMTNPPRDTECTNVPAGPQAATWLSRDVYRFVDQHLRVDHKPWSSIGWSTGAFCAAKLLLTHSQQFSAAVSLGGYFETLTDKTTGSLFGNRSTVMHHNSPLWLYQHGGLHRRALLAVSGKQDRGSYRSTRAFLKVARGDPGVASLIFGSGGHNYHNYRGYLPDALGWLQTQKAFG